MTASTATTCTIPVTVFKAAPYSLDWGVGVYAKVIATNLYGDSVESLEGNGAIITTTPDKPINLAENYSQRTKSTIGMTWEAASFTGGAVIIDYRISIAEQGGSFSVLASGLTSPEYLATDLTFGTTYEFKVESRNSYSFSPYSDTLTLLCAFKPDPPLTITTSNTLNTVTVQWSDPVANGSPITGYDVSVETTDGVTYEPEQADCTTSASTTRSCQISLETLKAAPYNLVKDQSVYVKIVSKNLYGDSEVS